MDWIVTAVGNRTVWVISCRCGWSRMVPRSTPAARRRQILTEHQNEKHPTKEES